MDPVMRLGVLRNVASRERLSAGRDDAMAGRALAASLAEGSLAEIAVAEAAGEAPAPAEAAGAPVRWSQQRLAMAEDLWGEGFLAPGGAAETLRQALPLGLSASSSVLLLGAGAGGPPRTLAAELGAWVTAFDSDPVLVGLAQRRIQRAGAGQAKRATVATWSPEAPDFERSAFDHAVAVDALGAGTLAPTLAALTGAIKPGGQLVLVQTVIDPSLDPADPAVAAWRRLDPAAADLPSEEAVTATLLGLGFEVRAVESQSVRHARLAVQGWKTAVRNLRGSRPTPAQAAVLVAEAEFWTRRLRLMHAGHVHHIRWHAAGSGG